jgi:cell division protein FtsB
MARRKRPAAYQKKKQNKFAMLLVTAVLFMLIAIVSVKGSQLSAEASNYQKQEKEWQSKISSEQDRSKELKEYVKYTQTRKYIEEVAKEKLGLVYKDQIVFESEENK